MSYRVTVEPSQHVFQAESDETLLEAALRQGINLPYGCRNGACGACKGTVVSGEFDPGSTQAHALNDAERAAGKTLFCCAKARSDLTVECKEVGSKEIQAKTFPARVQAMVRRAADVIELQLKLPATERLQFLAGQYVDILLKDGHRRSFSLANAPHDDALLILHVRHIPGGVFTDQVFSTMKERDILRLNGPHGFFFLREDSPKPIVFVAGGTGFAPVKSIVEHALHNRIARPITIYWGSRTVAGLYQADLPAQWAAAHSHIRFVPVVSEPDAGDGWTGRTGLVHQAVMQDLPDLSDHQVYACGAPAMVDAAREGLTQDCGLPLAEFFADTFSFASDGA